MQNYDNNEDFINYDSKDEWKNYIKDSLIPLWKYSWIIKDVFELLKKEFNEIPINNIQESDLPLLLGGVIDDKESYYTHDSLARFYTQIFGLGLKDIQSWILQSHSGEILTEIVVEVVKTDVIELAEKIFELTSYALKNQSLIPDIREPDDNCEEYKKNPVKLKEIIDNFYQSVLNFVINHNYGTFFLCSLNHVPYHYLKTAYSKLDKVLNFLINQFDLIELTWNNPIKKETKAYEKYQIYCFPEYNPEKTGKSLGGAICKLNELIFKFFGEYGELRKSLEMLYSDIPVLKKEYEEKIKNRLNSMEYHNMIFYRGILASEKGNFAEHKAKTIMDMLDDNSPLLFTNVIKIDYVHDDRMRFNPLN